MKPAAHIQATIDLVGLVLSKGDVPADHSLSSYFRARRYIGAKDRQSITKLTYKILRSYLLLQALYRECWPFPKDKGIQSENFQNLTETPKNPLAENVQARPLTLAAMVCLESYSLGEIESLFSQGLYGPSPLNGQEKKFLEILSTFSLSSLSLPEQWGLHPWQWEQLSQMYGEDILPLLQSLSVSAPLDLRVNLLKTSREAVEKVLMEEGFAFEKGTYSPWRLRIAGRRPLGQHPLWKKGWIDVQDEGSQLISWLTDPKPGQAVWDYCAGAGGKTLALAVLMENRGRLIASDPVPWRLERAQERCRRAGVHNIRWKVLPQGEKKKGNPESLLKKYYGQMDRVLVDVPCSGSGTWRRNPDLKWRLSLEDFEELLSLQKEILTQTAPLVKPGGRLIYATCSLFRKENEDQIRWFLEHHPGFALKPVGDVWSTLPLCSPCPTEHPTLQLRPDRHQVDGFFVGILERK